MPRSRAWFQSERKTQKKSEIVPLKPSEPGQPSIASSVVQGFGFGVGSAVAHNVVGSVAKSLTSGNQSNTTAVKPECEEYRRAFDACILDESCSNEMARTMWIDVKKYCVKENS